MHLTEDEHRRKTVARCASDRRPATPPVREPRPSQVGLARAQGRRHKAVRLTAGAVAAAGLIAAWVIFGIGELRIRPPTPNAQTTRMLFKSDGTNHFMLQPVEGYDVQTPIDPECARHGYPYRIHVPIFAGPWCAFFYEDELRPGEEQLVTLGIHNVVRFTITPASQAASHPLPDAVRGKKSVAPQAYIQRGEEIERRLAATRERTVMPAAATRT